MRAINKLMMVGVLAMCSVVAHADMSTYDKIVARHEAKEVRRIDEEQMPTENRRLFAVYHDGRGCIDPANEGRDTIVEPSMNRLTELEIPSRYRDEFGGKTAYLYQTVDTNGSRVFLMTGTASQCDAVSKTYKELAR